MGSTGVSVGELKAGPGKGGQYGLIFPLTPCTQKLAGMPGISSDPAPDRTRTGDRRTLGGGKLRGSLTGTGARDRSGGAPRGTLFRIRSNSYR